MTPARLVLLIFLVETALVALVAAIVVVHAVVMRGAAPRQRARLRRGRAVLYAGVAARRVDDPEFATLAALPRKSLVLVFAELAPSLVGADREWLGDLAERCGLVDDAERLSRSRLWWRRLRASRLLMLFSRGENAQLRLAADAHPLVRAQAAEALAARASDASIQTLVSMLADPDELCRFNARDALMRLGPAARAAVLAHLREPGAPALEALLAIAAAAPSYELVAAALASRDHPDRLIRLRVIDLLRALGGAEAAAALGQMLDDPDEAVRARAAEGLASLGHWPAAGDLARLLEDPVWDVRLTAALALQRLGAPGELVLQHVARRDGDAAPIARRVLDAAAQLRFGAPA